MKMQTKAVCVLLSALMLLNILPRDVYTVGSGAVEQAESTDIALPAETEVTAVGEVVSKRTANTKTVWMSDGSYRLVQYASDVHYEANGEWHEYDNSLTLSSASSETVSVNGVSQETTPYFKAASNPGGLKFGQSAATNVLSFVESDNHRVE